MKRNTTYCSVNTLSSRGNTGMDQSFTFHEGTLNSSMASLSIQRDHPTTPLNTSMASLSTGIQSCDATDGPVEFPKDNIDVVFVDGDNDKKLCFATVSHDGEKITGCGGGNSRESARESAITNLVSNFKILYTPVKI